MSETARERGDTPAGRRTDAIATSQFLYGTLATPNVVTAVARRLRAAVGLGLLVDGERLPKETALAEQLGVTKFALREALGALRAEGLIVTRPGKQGGSFVRVDSDITGDVHAELRRLSTAELRDLGDWRRMLLAGAAALAAKRASSAVPARLRSLADEVSSSSTVQQARRACGRFYVELAAAAQSTRMVTAEFSMHEEYDRLLVLPLSDAEYRKRTGQELAVVADAVATRNEGAAHTAAARHVASTIGSLVQLRLAAISSGFAGHAGRPSPHRAGDAAGLAAEVGRVLALIIERLGLLAGVAEEAHGVGLDVARRDLSRATVAELVGTDIAIYGMGFIAEPMLAPEQRPWMDWWRRTPTGAEHDTRHVLDPARDDFYDYTLHEYFSYPRRDHAPWTEGPYVDHGGVDDYVLTVSQPVLSAGTFVGITAADVLVAELERHLAPWLLDLTRPHVLLNDDRRVVLSNSAGYIVGDLVPDGATQVIEEIGRFGWTVEIAET